MGSRLPVKILSQRSNQGEAEFLKEIKILKNLRHENIVALVGYCDEGVTRAIIYEFLHQDLTKFLGGNDCRLKDWTLRLRITLGIATGLCFMHEHHIAHGDLKPDNILLSESLEPKLGDFGMCKQFPAEATYLYSPPCRGSIGFMDPGYHASCNYRLESDVYAFGIILLMLISGRPVISIGEDGYNINIIHLLMGKDVEEVVDIKLAGRYSRVSAKSALQLAQRCTSMEYTERPSMRIVVIGLDGCLAGGI